MNYLGRNNNSLQLSSYRVLSKKDERRDQEKVNSFVAELSNYAPSSHGNLAISFGNT